MGKYWWEEEEEQKKQQSTQNTSQSTEQKKGYWWEDESTVSTAANQITERVNTWMQNHDKYITNYKNRFSVRKGGYDDDYVSDSGDWLKTVAQQKENFKAEAESILSYMDQYKDYLDANWMNSVRKALVEGTQQQRKIVDGATKDNEWWNSFNDQNKYGKYGSAEEGYKSEQRKAGYQKTYEGMTSEEISDVIAKLDDGEEREWLTAYKPVVEYEENTKLDTDALQSEIDAMEEVYKKAESIALNMGMGGQESDDAAAYNIRDIIGKFSNGEYDSMEELEKAISQKKQKLTQASRIQEGIRLSSVADKNSENYDPEFASKTGYVSTESNKWHSGLTTQFGLGYDDLVYEYINGKDNGLREEILHKVIMNDYDPDDYYIYDHMTEDQIDLYNYYYKEGGEEGAKRYLDSIKDALIYKEAEQKFAAKKGKTGQELLYGVAAGVDQFQSGIKNLFNFKDEYIPYSTTQVVSGMIREDLADNGFDLPEWLGGGSFAQGAYDMITTTANMAPSILVSTAIGAINPVAGSVAGNALMGASAAGNAYQDAINRGFDKKEARFYSTAIGASEALLQQLLGGIGKLGGVSSKITKAVSGIENGLLRFSLKYGGKLLSEGLEEGLQEVLNPVFQNALLHTDEEVNWSEVAYSALLGALSAGLLEGVGTAVEVRTEEQAKNKLAEKVYGKNTDSLIQDGLASDEKSASFKLATKYQQQVQGKDGAAGKAMTGSQIRKLLAANQDQIKPKDMKLIQEAAKKRLTELGQTGDLDKLAALATKFATGGTLTKAERSTLARTNYGARVANELLPENIKSGEFTSEWAENIGTREVNFEAYNKEKVEKAREAFAEMVRKATEDPNAYKPLESRVEAESEVQVSDTGKSVIRGTDQEIDLSKPHFKEITEDRVVLYADGKAVDANNIDYADADLGYAIKAVGKIEHMTPEYAGAMVGLVDKAQPVVAQMNGLDEAFTYGFYNYSEADLKAGLFTGNLTPVQLNDAYKLGQHVRSKTDMDADAPVVKMRTAAEAKPSEEQKLAKQKAEIENDDVEVYFEDGGTVVKFDEHTGKYDKKRMAAVNTAKFLAKLKIGGKYYFFESYVNEAGDRVYKDADGNEVEAPNGIYKDSDGSIHIDLNAGDDGSGIALYTLGHELAHFVKAQSKKQFKILADLVTEAFDKTDLSMRERVLTKQKFLEDKRGEKVSYDEAYEEVVADAMSTMLTDGTFHEKLMEIKVKDKGLFNTIKRFFEKMIAKFRKEYEQLTPDQQDAQDIRAMKDMFDKIQTAFAEALVEASDNFHTSEQVLAQSGISVNAETESGSLQSVRDVLSEADKKKAAKALVDRFDVTEKEAMGWLKAETSLASLILNPKYSQFLDYEADPNEVAIKQNSDYPQGTVDFSNICKKRREFTQVMNRILRNFPNHVFAATDLAKIRTIMGEEGMTLPCGICYVEDRRQLDTIVAQDFINGLKLYREGSKTRPDGKPFNANQLKGLQLTDGDTYVPTIYELVSLEGRNSLKAKNPNMEAAWVRYNNARGLQAVRLLTNEAEYKRQILKYNKSTVQSKNDHGGLRIYSFSDAEMFHLIDIVQVITDSATVGLKLQGYTKVNEYAKAVKDTGEKLNRSLIPLGDLGYHIENGKVVLDYDTVEGIDIYSKDFFDNKDNPDVGNITIGINDVQIRAAMVSDFVDQIIPFHTGQSEEVLGEKGIAAWDNYKDYQTEKDIATGKTSSHQINIYTEVFQAAENEGKPIQNKKQFVEKFLQVCKENGLQPRFSQFLNVDSNGNYVYTEGYHKLLVDFKTFAQTEVGEYLPQMPVKPIFDDGYITGLLENYVTEQKAKDAEVAEQMPKVIERITNEIVKPVKRSDRYISVDTSLDVIYHKGKTVGQEVKGNETREETREAFIRRAGETSLEVGERGALTFGYRHYFGQLSQNVQAAEKGLKNLGIPVVVFEHIEGNKDGTTTIYNNDALSIPGVAVFIHKDATVDSVEIIGHEGYHYLKGSDIRIAYREVMAANVDFSSKAIIEYQQKYVGDSYFSEDVVIGSKEWDTLIEELFAYITGDIHAGDPNGEVHKFIRDYDAVKAAWDDVLKKQASTPRYSERDSTGKQLSNEQQAYFANSVVRDADGRLMVMYHGTANGGAFTVFDGDKLGNESRTSQVGQGFYFTNAKAEAKSYTKNVDIYGRRSMGKNPYLHEVYLNITNPFNVAEDTLNLDDVKAVYTDGTYDYFFNSWIPFYLDRKSVNGEVLTKAVVQAMSKEEKVSLYVDYLSKLGTKELLSNMVRAFPYGKQSELLAAMQNRMGYDGIVEEYAPGKYQYVAFSSEQIKSTDNKKPTADKDIRYSERNNAPTFYSQMGKVVEGMKQEKFGASSVISMLRGRGVKAEEIRWSGIQAFLDGKKSVTKEELLDFINNSMLQIEEETRSKNDTRTEFVQAWRSFVDQDLDESEILAGLDNLDEMESYLESLVEDGDLDRYYADYILDVAKKVDNKDLPAKWDQYKLDGGENYRELIFKMPGATYTNKAMQAHWGDDTQGVLAHARMQDFNVDGKKMLFIEEIQSDWHNAGHKYGYGAGMTESEKDAERVKIREDFMSSDVGKSIIKKVEQQRASDSLQQPFKDVNEVYDWIAFQPLNIGTDLMIEYPHWATNERLNALMALDEKISKLNGVFAPDAPFHDNYHEFVLKRLLRMAAEEGYDSIGWTTADIQSERWSDDYAEGYRIEYDQDIPKFLKKYGKQWGATVGKTNIDTRGVTDWEKDMLAKGIIELVPYESEVWTMDITDAMKKSVLTEGQAMYSERGEGSSNRHLLANAFEGISQNSEEYKMIQEYRKEIGLLNRLDEELQDINQQIRDIRFSKGPRDNQKLRNLEEKAARIARDISKQDKQLLNMEASEPLRKVIAQERKKENQKVREHINEIQQNKKMRAEQTELRHKIRKTVRDLDKILNRGNKKQNVKEDMKGFASKALELADYLFTDHISNDDLIRNGITVRMTPKEAALVKETEEILSKLYDQADSLTDEEFKRLDEKRKANEYKLRDLLTAQRNERLNTPVYNLFNDLVTEYAKLKNSGQEAVKAAYNADVERFLRSYIGEANGETDSDRKTLLQNMRVADMTTDELWKLSNAYEMVLHSIRQANNLFVKGKSETLEQKVGRIAKDFESRKIPEGKLATVARNLSNKMGWDYEKLYYALDRIGSEAFTELVMNIADAENTVMQDVIEAAAFRDEMVKKYDYNNWKVNKEIDREFLDSTGKKFKLTLGQLMALYAYSRRDGAWDHIEYGGFVFGEAALTNPRPADSYKLSKEQCMAITDLLTKEQKGYAEDMQKFLSETMGEKGNEVSMLLYGIKMFGEKNYFPIHIAGQFKAQANESQAKAAAGFSSMTNAGFTHAQNPNAKAPFVLEGFNEIWVDHVNEMSRYHGTVPALEDMRRVMNYSHYSEASAESMAIKQLMENSFGKEAVDYFDNLYREANSGAITDKLQKWPKKLLSLFRKNSVAYSLSVLVQQPASVVRAYAMIDRKYFGVKGVGVITSGVAKAIGNKWTKAHTNAYNEMLKYAPGVTMAKEIGGFDTATGGSIRSYLLDTNKSLKQTLKTGNAKEVIGGLANVVDDNAIANLPNVADKIAWIEIWTACKRETVAKHKDLATNSEEFLKIVGERFTEVIRATQVYDSIFSKSPMLKSKNLAVQYLVSFMNEPNTVANMVEKAVRDAAKGNWKSGARTAAVVIHSIIFTNVLKSMIYAMRDDDEDETYIEKYLESITGGLIGDFNPLGYIPMVRDAWSIWQGYDVERPDMAIVQDAISAIDAAIKNKNKDTDEMTEEQLIAFDKKVTEANWKVVESMTAFFGIPVKNIRREVNGVINTIKNTAQNSGLTTSNSVWDKVSEAVDRAIPFVKFDKNKQDKLYEAILSGDTAYVDRLKATYKDEDAYHSAVRKLLRENDPRIREAAQARYDGNIAKTKQLYQEIKKEGKFDPNDILEAINSEEAAIKKDTEPKSESSEYSATDFVDAILLGDANTAKTMRDSIIQFKVKGGKTPEEAEASFAESVRDATKNAFNDDLLDAAGAKNMLLEYADMDEEEAAAKVEYWDFVKENPKYKDDFTQERYEKYKEWAEPAEIPLDIFVQYVKGTSGLKTIYDEWGDEELSLRDQVLAVIDSLDLTWQQKDALYLAHGYAESEIWDVPW